MRAVVVRSYGGPEALEVTEVPVPAPGPGQVRIRVQGAAVNPVDVFVRSGMAIQVGLLPARDSVGVGWDVAGVVDEVGPGAGFAEGDRVIGLADRLDVPTAGYADYLVLDADAVAAAPSGVAPEAAATLPLNALTAAQSLDLLDLRPGQSLLVTGAAGAVGGYAVQLAAAAGLRVVATAWAGDEALVRGFGAELFVPRAAEPSAPREAESAALGSGTLPARVRALVPGGVHGVLDAAVLGLPALDALRGGGAFVSVISGVAPPPLRGTRVSTVFVRADGARLAELVRLVEAGTLTLRVAETFPLEKAAAAHQRLAEGPLRGRLVLLP
jgi:NADPH:quinone reductase-like Zn-dependent oxidoreductase